MNILPGGVYMQFLKMIFGVASIASSAALLFITATGLIPIYLVDSMYIIGVIGLVGGIGTYSLIIKELVN